MKKTVGILILIAALMLSGCSGALDRQPSETVSEPQTQATEAQTQATEAQTQDTVPVTESAVTEPAEETGIPAAYGSILDAYAQAAREGWGPGTLAEKGMNWMAADIFGDNPGQNLGYVVTDLDGDGLQELMIGATERVTDDFYGRLVLELYTLSADGSAVSLFSSMERDRYYSLGDNRFVHRGSSSASDSFDTTVALENGALTDLGYADDPKQYAPLPLEPVGSWIGLEPEFLQLPILDEINENTRVGTTGAFLTAVQSAAKLLDWAIATGLDPQEIKEATVLWLQNQGNDAQLEFREKMEKVDEAVKQLLEDGAEDLLSSAGCENTGYPWDEYPLATIEAIMEAVGLRQ